jgi:hypothetical protein
MAYPQFLLRFSIDVSREMYDVDIARIFAMRLEAQISKHEVLRRLAEVKAESEFLRGMEAPRLKVEVFIMPSGVPDQGLLLQEVLQEIKALVNDIKGLKKAVLWTRSGQVVPIDRVGEKDLLDTRYMW